MPFAFLIGCRVFRLDSGFNLQDTRTTEYSSIDDQAVGKGREIELRLRSQHGLWAWKEGCGLACGYEMAATAFDKGGLRPAARVGQGLVWWQVCPAMKA